MKIKLSHKEEEAMQILWKMEKAFVNEIIDEMPDPKPPYNTISSMFRKLEKMGVVAHDSFGKAYRYYPILKKEDYRKSTFKKMLNAYFGGSKEQMFSYFAKEEDMSVDDMDEILKKIKEEEE